MCGIVGEIWSNGRVNEVLLSERLQSLAARGPDGEGLQILEGGRVGLGHRRLSILSLIHI